MRSQKHQHKRKKFAIDKTYHKEPLVTDNPVIKEPSYFNLFESGGNLLNRIDVTCERACMATSRERYHTESYNNLTDDNDHTNTPLSIEKIREKVRKVMDEESILGANNVTADILSDTSNTQI